MDMKTPDTEEKSPQQEWLDRAKEDIDTNLKHMNNQPIFNTPDTEKCEECEQYGKIRVGSVHKIKAMNCRIKPSDPVFFDPNTPDTEFDSDKEVVGSDCLCVLGSKKHNPECEYATPGTEWTEALQVEVMDDYLHLAEMRQFAKDPVAHMEEMREHWQKLQDFISTLLTSRDTYWKERVEKEVEAIRKPEREEPNEMADMKKWEVWDRLTDEDEIYNQALDTLLDNLK